MGIHACYDRIGVVTSTRMQYVSMELLFYIYILYMYVSVCIHV